MKSRLRNCRGAQARKRRTDVPIRGIAVYVPLVIRKSAPYFIVKLSGLSIMAKPEIAAAMETTMKAKRCLARSEKKAMNIAKPKAVAQGGTEKTTPFVNVMPRKIRRTYAGSAPGYSCSPQ